MQRLLVFDFDGTLVDSSATLERALQKTFVRLGLAPPPAGHCRSAIGLSLAEAARG